MLDHRLVIHPNPVDCLLITALQTRALETHELAMIRMLSVDVLSRPETRTGFEISALGKAKDIEDGVSYVYWLKAR